MRYAAWERLLAFQLGAFLQFDSDYSGVDDASPPFSFFPVSDVSPVYHAYGMLLTEGSPRSWFGWY